MKILFLAESLNNQTVENLVDAINHSGHQLDVIPYFSGGSNQCAIAQYEGTALLTYQGRPYFPANYDLALLWSWGTATLGRKYLRVFEDQGVAVVNSTYITEVTDSKVRMIKKLQENDIPIPDTLYFEDDFTIEDIEKVDIKKSLGLPPYVFKSDYSTRGCGVRFAHSEEQVRQFARELATSSPKNKSFVVQQFIGDANSPISHYRVLVLGDEVFPFAMKAMAQEPLKVSNIASGAGVNLAPLTPELKTTALNAAKVAGLKIAGVDLMIEWRGNQQHIVVLEVNDGPGTKTFDREGCNASKAVIDYILNNSSAIDLYQQADKQISSNFYTDFG